MFVDLLANKAAVKVENDAETIIIVRCLFVKDGHPSQFPSDLLFTVKSTVWNFCCR